MKQKRYYNLVISVLDTDENRVDSYDVAGSTDRNIILLQREHIDKDIENGKYDFLQRENCTLEVDIEVHDNDTWELLYII